MISADSLRALYRAASSTAGADNETRIGLAIITCMDPRLHPERSLGIDIGDAYIIRNAGGRASNDALRSLVVASAILGVDRVVVIHHTDCRLLTLTDAEMTIRLRRRLGLDVQVGDIDFMTFSHLETSVRSDITRINQCAFLPKTLTVTGFVCDTSSGQLEPVPTEKPQPAGTGSHGQSNANVDMPSKHQVAGWTFGRTAYGP